MSAFTLDITGQLNNMRLSESKSLWPLFEAIVNAIQAIEDSDNANKGQISIFAKREDLPQEAIFSKAQLGKFESFVITDNGIGMNNENYKSFNTAYSTFKIKKGCKGIGRFVWLKAFKHVKVESIFCEDKQFYARSFIFSPDGIEPESNTTITDEHITKTIITLDGFLPKYKNAAPIELDTVAKKSLNIVCRFLFLANARRLFFMMEFQTI